MEQSSTATNQVEAFSCGDAMFPQGKSSPDTKVEAVHVMQSSNFRQEQRSPDHAKSHTPRASVTKFTHLPDDGLKDNERAITSPVQNAFSVLLSSNRAVQSKASTQDSSVHLPFAKGSKWVQVGLVNTTPCLVDSCWLSHSSSNTQNWKMG